MDLPQDFHYMLYRAPSIRYHDTSYIINRKWLRGGDELTFPIVHHFVNSDAKIRSESNKIENNNDKLFHYATDNENDKIIQQQRRRNNHKDKPRRRTRSLEKRKRPLSAEHQQYQETSDDEELIKKSMKENTNNNEPQSEYDKSKNSDEIDSSCGAINDDTTIQNPNEDQNNNNNNNKNKLFHLCHERVIRLEIIEKPNNKNGSIKNNEESQQNNKENVTKDKNFVVSNKVKLEIPQIIEPNPDYETISSTSTTLTNRNYSQNVIVDIHRRPDSVASSNLSSEILMINENSSDDDDVADDDDGNKLMTKDNVPEFNQQRIKKNDNDDNEKKKRNSRSSDSSDKTITQEQLLNVNLKNLNTNNNNEYTKNNDKPIILSGKRFFYIQGTSNSSSGMSASSSSTINDIDEDSCMDDYEQVELRRSGTSQSLPVERSQQLMPKNLNDNDIRIDHNNISKSQSFPVQTKHHNHQDHRSNLQISNNLHLHYVTQRILASILPRREPAAENDIQSFGPHNENQLPDKYEKEVISMLEQKHGKNYRVFDLESCISVITLERICELCKYIDKWLASGQEKVVVLQDRDNRQRLGAAIAAYLQYLDICASNFATTSRNKSQQRNSTGSSSQDDLRAQNAITKNWLDLDIFSMKKFLEEFIGPLRIPSHKRYINYFTGLLSGKIKLNSSPVILKYIGIESPPSWLQYNGMSSDTEWNSFIKIYEGLRCVYTSDIHIIPITTRQFLYQVGNLQLRGDILIRCYQIVSTNSTLNNNNYYANGGGNLQLQDKRELLFSLQFHTCAMFSTEVTFKKEELDYAWCDNRFPNDCRVTFHFNKGTKNISNDNGYVFQSPLIRTEPPNALAKSNSIENFDLSTKYQGPLDGSLYATILKSPKSSQYQPITSQSQQQQNRTSSSSVSLLTNLISPPPQFSNNNNIQQKFDTSTPIRQTARHSVEPNRLSSTSTTTITSTSSSANQQQHQNNSRPGTLVRSTQSQPRTEYFYVENRPATLQSNYRDSANKYPSTSSGGQQQQHTKVVETYQRTQNRSSQQHSQQNGTGRDSVRSPLTLSMDSGISSSGVLRAQQGSSVSPSSFPSQASPQEDRHRELDDILSDMLMTVQDIPDLNNKVKSNNKTNTINSKQTIYRQQQQQHNTIRSQSVIPTLPQQTIQLQPATSLYELPVAHPTYANDTNNRELKRSVSYAAYESSSPQQTIIINPYLSVKDLYDTASTTTTLTPPPSESGRDTPTQHIIVGSNRCLHHQQQYEQRQKQNRFDTLSSMASSTNTLKSQATTTSRCTSRCGGGNIDLQQNISPQSSTNPHQVRTTTTQLLVSEDDDNIPYHAREHSKPFTYGNVPNGHQLSEIPVGQDEIDTSVEIFDPKMIKAQSGLSSPSLVRKFGGGGSSGNVTINNQSSTQSTLRKTPARNDFEDMLRERREKVMSEKYLISDKPTSVDQNQKWINTTINQTNGYHYYNEPLKRSNTLDGFQRSNSTDGLSGQTWLQLQQQKLRAKKGQQLRDERKYFEEIHTEIRNRPQKSLANGRRYDGYASDTAAFGEEVDYRRPLHVQMPYNTSRSPERKYNTITTTTTTTTTNKERPFVAVKRAHEQAKRENVGSPPLSPLSLLNASPTGHIINQNQNGLLSMAESSRNGQTRLMREESFSSYRSETDHELSSAGSPRPETPAFPVTPRTPYGLSNGSVSPALPPKSPTSQRKDLYSGNQKGHVEFANQNDQIFYTTRRNSNSSTTTSEPQEVAPHHVKFVRDSSKYWYKPTISREEAITLLRNAQPGTFIVRDSTTFKNAFGLVVRVAQLPPGVTAKQGGDELVRHFLVEPTSRGVRLKGCANEPVFTSLSALVYQHSIMPLALPCRLLIPDRDIQSVEIHTPAQKQLLSQGAACNVLYLFACDTESLTGEEAVRRAVSQLYSRKPLPVPTEVHFKVAQQGITLTDNTRQKFFRKHYSNNIVSFCGFDPDRRTWSIKTEADFPVQNKTIFAFVARRSASSHDNQCHVFCDLAPNQPATAIVSFVNKVLPTEKSVNENI